jgi:hypothetical protein
MKDQDTSGRQTSAEPCDTQWVTPGDAAWERGEDGRLTVFVYGEGQRVRLDALGALQLHRVLGAILSSEP